MNMQTNTQRGLPLTHFKTGKSQDWQDRPSRAEAMQRTPTRRDPSLQALLIMLYALGLHLVTTETNDNRTLPGINMKLT